MIRKSVLNKRSCLCTKKTWRNLSAGKEEFVLNCSSTDMVKVISFVGLG